MVLANDQSINPSQILRANTHLSSLTSHLSSSSSPRKTPIDRIPNQIIKPIDPPPQPALIHDRRELIRRQRQAVPHVGPIDDLLDDPNLHLLDVDGLLEVLGNQVPARHAKDERDEDDEEDEEEDGSGPARGAAGGLLIGGGGGGGGGGAHLDDLVVVEAHGVEPVPGEVEDGFGRGGGRHVNGRVEVVVGEGLHLGCSWGGHRGILGDGRSAVRRMVLGTREL